MTADPYDGMCIECTKDLDDDGDCFECGTGKYAKDCKCGKGDWLCSYHQRNENCKGVSA